MQFRLRTLLIVLAVGPIFLAACYWGAKEWQRRQAETEAMARTKAEYERLNLIYMKAVYRRWRYDEAHPETASLVGQLNELERQMSKEDGNKSP